MERLDDILGYSNLKIYQDSNFFSFSLDSVILSNFVNIRKRDKNIVDFCTGNGVVPLILSRRTSKNIVGVEIQEKIAELAKKSVKYNHLDKQISIVCEDVKLYSKKHLNEVDLLLCNPPYFKVQEKSSLNLSYEKLIARHELLLDFSELCSCVKKVLKDNGTFCFVHRSERFLELLIELRKHNLEPKSVKFIYNTINDEANLVIIHAQKSGKTGLKIEKPLFLYELDGTMTKEYYKLQEEVRE